MHAKLLFDYFGSLLCNGLCTIGKQYIKELVHYCYFLIIIWKTWNQKKKKKKKREREREKVVVVVIGF